MRRAIRTAVGILADVFAPPAPVVEIGSLYLPGYEALCDLRPFFGGSAYIGCDLRPGRGVDRIEDAQALSFGDGEVGTLLLLETLEHLPDPSRAISEAYRVLRSDGLLALSVPFNYRLHGFPTDYWRFTASGIYTLLAPFGDKVVLAVGPRVKPAFVFAVAARTASVEFAARAACFRVCIGQAFAHERWRGYSSVLKERARDFFGCLVGRADLSVEFFDPHRGGGYDIR